MSHKTIKRCCYGLVAQLCRNILILFAGLIILIHNPANALETEEVSTEAQASSDTDSSDGWDWDSFEADDTPLAPNEAVRQTNQTAASRRLTIDEVTSPDLEKQPKQVYPLFKGIPAFEVIASIKDSEMHPCSNCHEWVKSNTTPRKLDTPHDNFQLEHGLHGKGQFWCFTCHELNGSSALKTLDGESIEFEDAYIVCSQCHVDQARDWAFGAHGKRLGNWQGKRQVFNCTVCHYQHSPSWKPRDALAGPNIRQGLERPAHWIPAHKDDTSLHSHEEMTLHQHDVIWSNRHE